MLLKPGWVITSIDLGTDGRIKSTLGIGLLLLDGLGDTIRMSLTEDPWHEIAPCKQLLNHISTLRTKKVEDFVEMHRDFTNIARRNLDYTQNKIGDNILNKDGTVAVSTPISEFADPINLYNSLGLELVNGIPRKTLNSADMIYIPSLNPHSLSYGRTFKELAEAGVSLLANYDDLIKYRIPQAIPLIDLDSPNLSTNFQCISDLNHRGHFAMRIRGNEDIHTFKQNSKLNPSFFVVDLPIDGDIISTHRRVMNIVCELELSQPIIFYIPRQLVYNG